MKTVIFNFLRQITIPSIILGGCMTFLNFSDLFADTSLTNLTTPTPPATTQEVAPKSQTQYILFACPDGPLGAEVKAYWNEVLSDPDLEHKAITFYPPHCSLTRFFNTDLSPAQFDSILKEVKENLCNTPKKIDVEILVFGPRRDYIRMNSPYFYLFSKGFVEKVGQSARMVKNPKVFPYHIILRDHNFKSRKRDEHLEKIQKLEREIDLAVDAQWSITVYARKDDRLEPVASVKL